MVSACVCEQRPGGWCSRRAEPREERGFPRNTKSVTTRPRGFPRANRITKPKEYQEIFKSSRRYTESILVILARRKPADPARLGLSISNRWIKDAVSRNRIKRLIKESFRLDKNRLKGFDIVVMARGNLHGLDNKQLTRSLDKLWSRVEKCRESP